jgi:hypothetical protein
MFLPDSASEMVFMNASALEEYRGRIDQKLYLVKLLPVLSSLLSPILLNWAEQRGQRHQVSHWFYRAKVIVESVGRSRHTHDIINGFKTGSAACTLPP